MKLVISLPIGHHAGLRELMGRFGQYLLHDTDPPILGLDESVLIPPRRLHFTLGVMSLASTSSTADSRGSTDPTVQSRTLGDAVRFLESLKPRVDELLRVSVTDPAHRAQKIRAVLNSMDTMKLERGGAAHVLWVGPKDGNSKHITDEKTDKFRRVCDFIHTSFKGAGFLVEDNRPLKLHCTIINTAHRKPRPPGGKRIPFAYPDLVTSPWFSRPDTSSIPSLPQSSSAQVVSNTGYRSTRGPVSVDFGTWDIDEVQICEMGSQGPEGEYVCVGRISL